MIKIYTAEDVNAYIDNTDARAFISGHNRRVFGPDIKQLFLRNDDNTKWASNIKLKVLSPNFDLISGQNGFGIKLIYSQVIPSSRMWFRTPYANELTIPSIGGVATPDLTFHPFWIRVETSSSVTVGTYEGSFELTYIEHAV